LIEPKKDPYIDEDVSVKIQSLDKKQQKRNNHNNNEISIEFHAFYPYSLFDFKDNIDSLYFGIEFYRRNEVVATIPLEIKQ
jgi:hypothetical protein